MTDQIDVLTKNPVEQDMSTMDDRMPAAFRELFESCMNVCHSVEGGSMKGT